MFISTQQRHAAADLSDSIYGPIFINEADLLLQRRRQGLLDVPIERGGGGGGGGMSAMAKLSWTEDVLPFAAMIMVECGEMVMITLAKAAMNKGMSNLVYVVYYNALGTLVLFPYFAFRSLGSDRSPLTPSLLCRFFILGLVGICLLQVFSFTAINYSSTTLAAAMGNLVPAFTFVLAVIFRMEKLNLRRWSSRAKSLGTIVAVSGAFVITLYKGPPIFMPKPLNASYQPPLSQESHWILGGLLLAVTCILSSSWNILQTATVKAYPEEITIVFFSCCFGTIQCAIFSLCLERKPGAWLLQPGIEMIATMYSALFASVFRSNVLTWCLHKKGPVYVAMFKPTGIAIAAIMGVIFLSDTLYLGSVIGAIIIAIGFYTVMWGQYKEKDIDCGLESSPDNIPFLET